MSYSRRPWALNGEAIVLEFVVSNNIKPLSIIYMDRWFTSVKLARYLADEFRIKSSGPISKTRTSFPTASKKDKEEGKQMLSVEMFKRDRRGDFRTLVCDVRRLNVGGGQITAQGWRDTGVVYWISAGFGLAAAQVVRNVHRKGEKVPVKDRYKYVPT